MNFSDRSCCQKYKEIRNAICITLILCLLFCRPAHGDTSTEPTIIGPGLTGLELKPGVDLSGRNFNGTQLVRVDLSGAIFDDAHLGGAIFEDCVLVGASFRNASLSGAIFRGTNITDANFENADITDMYLEGWGRPSQLLQTRSFREKTLYGVRFNRRSLGDHTDLRGFDLSNATLLHGDFRDVQFDGARITGTSFEGKTDFEQLRNTIEVRDRTFPAKLYAASNCNLSGLNLSGANLTFPPGITCDLTDARIDGSYLWFNGHPISEILASTWSYKQRRLRSLSLSYCDLSGISFDAMILDHVWLSGVNLGGATFRDTVFVRSRIEPYGKAFSAVPLKESYNFRHGHLAEIHGLPKESLQELGVQNGQ